MKQNGATLLLFLLLSISIANTNLLRDKVEEAKEERKEVAGKMKEEAEGKVRLFWGGDCLVDQDCLRVELSDVSLQVSVCQSRKAQCEPIAILWVLTTFLALVIILITTIIVLYFCNRK